MANDLDVRFRRYLIDLIVEMLLKQGSTVLTTNAVRRTPYGDVLRRRNGDVVFSQRQANLVPGLGTEVLVFEGKVWQGALGDSGRSKVRTIVPKRGGGAFPVPLVWQPFLNVAAAEQFNTFYNLPDYPPFWSLYPSAAPTLYDGSEPETPYPDDVRYLLDTTWAGGERPVPWEYWRLLDTPFPRQGAYLAGYDGEPYQATFGGGKWLGVFKGNPGERPYPLMPYPRANEQGTVLSALEGDPQSFSVPVTVEPLTWQRAAPGAEPAAVGDEVFGSAVSLPPLKVTVSKTSHNARWPATRITKDGYSATGEFDIIRDDYGYEPGGRFEVSTDYPQDLTGATREFVYNGEYVIPPSGFNGLQATWQALWAGTPNPPPEVIGAEATFTSRALLNTALRPGAWVRFSSASGGEHDGVTGAFVTAVREDSAGDYTVTFDRAVTLNINVLLSMPFVTAFPTAENYSVNAPTRYRITESVYRGEVRAFWRLTYHVAGNRYEVRYQPTALLRLFHVALLERYEGQNEAGEDLWVAMHNNRFVGPLFPRFAVDEYAQQVYAGEGYTLTSRLESGTQTPPFKSVSEPAGGLLAADAEFASVPDLQGYADATNRRFQDGYSGPLELRVLPPAYDPETGAGDSLYFNARSTNNTIYKGGHGTLPNPFGDSGRYEWFGLSGSANQVVADAFTHEGKTYAVVITASFAPPDYELELRVLVSIDNAPVGSYPLFDFFPRQQGRLSVDGRPWPNEAGYFIFRPSYNFLHPQWPFADAGHLHPFRVRARDLRLDKAGVTHTGEAAGAPITLFVENFAEGVDDGAIPTP